jgi:pyridoxal phosphate enzyme (YggS family)
VPDGTVPDGRRRAELAERLAMLRERIAAACRTAGRDPAGITLIAVTKTYPASDVLQLAALGVPDIGENRDQEAAPKARTVAAAGVEVRWHFVGHLQRNKAASVARYADLVHSVDSVRLAQALADAAHRHRDAPLDTLLQVSIDGDPARSGALVAGDDAERAIDRVAAAIAGADGLRLAGVMAIAPLDWEPGRAFGLLAEQAERIRAEHPEATVVSAGMSADLEPAIENGATHVRIGTALLGRRAPVR